MIEKILKLAKECKLLYVEDDKDTMANMRELFSSIFPKLYTASNGKEGLEAFKKDDIDLIITDINMPIMNGIEMIKAIRSVNSQIPIIVTSAYSDKEYLLESIFLGVDRYVNKPLDEEVFYRNLHSVLLSINRQKEAKEYEKLKVLSQINEASLSMLKETVDIYPSPTFVFKEDESLEFINSAASDLFSKDSLKELKTIENLNDFILERKGFISSFKSVGKEDNLKVVFKLLNSVKIFLVSSSKIDSSSGELHVISLSDITRLEYEKQKSQNLSSYLHDILRSLRREDSKKSTQKSYENIRLTAMHKEDKESAKEYIQSLSFEIKEELDELGDIEKELKDGLMELEEDFNLVALNAISTSFSKYAKTISSLIDFEDVGYSLENLAQFLSSLTSTSFNQDKMLILLQSILEDLIQWREMIFVKEEANDIHYLDASLLSSCLQIRADFGGESADGGDELEFF